jgi:hypothetical protein
MTAATSFSQLDADSGDNNFLTRIAESVLCVESLCIARYSSLYCVRDVDAGKILNSDLIILIDFGGMAFISLSMASLKRTVWSWTRGCSLSRAAAARRHFKARRYFSGTDISMAMRKDRAIAYSSEYTPQNLQFGHQCSSG